MSTAALAAALGLGLLLGQSEAARQLGLGDRPFEVQAEQLFYDAQEELYLAEGEVYFRRDDLAVRAQRLWVSRRTQRAVAEGRVVMVRGREVLQCARLEIDLAELGFQLDGFQLRLVSKTPPRELREALADGRAPELARARITLEGDRAVRRGPRALEVDGVRFTPCDCGPEAAPSFSVRASSASIDLEGGAWLHWPVFYVKEVPVFALPVAYLPLGERRTGLLTPRFGYDPVTGFRVTEPLFLTLGRSYDLTLSGTYYTRRGFAGAAEARWAPSTKSRGQLGLTVLLDDGVYDPAQGGFVRERARPLGRFALSGRHDSDLGAGKLALDLDLLGDPQWKAELAPSFLERQVEESVSRLTYAHAYERRLRLAVGAALRQDLRRSRYEGVGRERREVSLFSAELPGPGSVRYRLLELRMDAAPTPLTRGLPGLLGEARLAVAGFAAPSPEVPRFVRADFRPELAWPIHLFGRLVLAPSVALRTTAWSGEADSESLSLGQVALVARTELFTELSRRYGAVTHRVRPAARHLVLPVLARAGAQAFFTADEIDLLADVHQIAASLDSDFLHEGRRVFGLSALFGSDLGLGAHPGQGASPLMLTADVELHDLLPDSSLRLQARAGIDLELGRIEQLVASLQLLSSRWLTASILFGEMGARVPRSGFIAPEELVPSNTISRVGYRSPEELAMGLYDPTQGLPYIPYRGLTGGVTVRPWEALAIGASASFDFQYEAAALPEGADEQRQNSPLRNVGGYLRYDSPCECWGALLQVGWARDRAGPDIRVIVDLAQLGG